MTRRAPGAVRREQILDAAFALIASEGLEHFRLRRVAARAGIHHATLLHHFATKEALLQAVAAEMLRRLRGGAGSGATGLEGVRQEFDDLKDQLVHDAGLFAVLTEFQLRARHDPVVARLLAELEAHWTRHLTAILEAGVARGAVRADLDLSRAARLIEVIFKGIALESLGPDGPARAIAGLTMAVFVLERAWAADPDPGDAGVGAPPHLGTEPAEPNAPNPADVANERNDCHDADTKRRRMDPWPKT